MSVSNDAHVTGVLRFSSSCFRFCHGAPPPNDESSPCMWDPLDLTSSFHLLHNYRLSCTMMRDESNLQYNTMHHNAIQYNTIQNNTIWCNALPKCNRSGFCSIRKNIRASLVEPLFVHQWRDQTSPDIFPNRARTCTITCSSSLTKKYIFESKNLSTWERSWIHTWTHDASVSRAWETVHL